MKECPECETEATNAAMAGIGLAPPCLNCHHHVKAPETIECTCGQFTCSDCMRCCPKCDEWHCLACRPFVHCDFCSRYGCEDRMELATCIVCQRKMCFACKDSDFIVCDACNFGFCADHGMNDCTACDARFCINCKDSSTCGHIAGCPLMVIWYFRFDIDCVELGKPTTLSIDKWVLWSQHCSLFSFPLKYHLLDYVLFQNSSILCLFEKCFLTNPMCNDKLRDRLCNGLWCL